MASTQLTRSIGSTGDRQKGTFSMWIKKSKTATEQVFYSHYQDASNFLRARFNDTDTINVNVKLSGTDYFANTNAVFQDVGAFYHIVWAIDTTQATAADRYKVYVNGTQQTMASSNYPSQNENLIMNISGDTQAVGAMNSSTYFDGLMSYVAWTDGYTYAATDFGETDSSSGIWKIKTGPSVTYGTNGFFLKMDTSSPGTDTSGNSNTFTASGTPTLTQDNASNNFATMNSLDNYWAGSTFTNGNLSIATVTGNDTYNNATMGYSTGKWYWETKIIQSSTYDQVGITSKGSTASNQYMSSSLYSVVIKQDGNLWQNAGSGSGAVGGWSGTSWTTGDIIGIAHDATNNKIYVHKNGTYMNSGNPTTGSNGADTTASSSTDTGVWLPGVGDEISSGTASQFALNFGNGFFGTTAVASSNADAAGHGLMEYAVPTGFYTLNTKNLNTYG